jgi:hypothetical protein
MLRRVALVRIDVLEDLSASIIRATRTDSFEMSVLTRARRRNISEKGILHSHRRENLKSLGPLSSGRRKWYEKGSLLWGRGENIQCPWYDTYIVRSRFNVTAGNESWEATAYIMQPMNGNRVHLMNSAVHQGMVIAGGII